jgi:predicted DNA-binding transcriptional regulator YafY
MENLVTWLLTFGDKAEVIEPIEARKIVAQTVNRMSKIYEGG